MYSDIGCILYIYLKRDFYSSPIMGIDTTFVFVVLHGKCRKKVRLIKYHQIDIVRQVLFWGNSPDLLHVDTLLIPILLVIDLVLIFCVCVCVCICERYKRSINSTEIIIASRSSQQIPNYKHIENILHALLFLFARTLSVVNISNAYQTFITFTRIVDV